MLRHTIPLLFLLFLASCTPTLKTARTTGKRGALYPAVTGKGVLFQIKAPGATLITIAGTFNSWNADFSPLKEGKNGIWSVIIPLKPGLTYQYKYLLDGHWIADPSNPNAEEDGFGGYNSTFTVPKKGASR